MRWFGKQSYGKFEKMGGSWSKTKKAQADKPGSVGCWSELPQQRLIIYLEQESPLASNDLPTGIERAARVQLPEPASLFGLSAHKVYRASPVASRAVGSYPTFSPFPVEG